MKITPNKKLTFVLLISLMALTFSSFSMDGDKPGPKKLGSKNLLQPKTIQALDLPVPSTNPLKLQAMGKLKGNKNLWQTAFDDSFLDLKTKEQAAFSASSKQKKSIACDIPDDEFTQKKLKTKKITTKIENSLVKNFNPDEKSFKDLEEFNKFIQRKIKNVNTEPLSLSHAIEQTELKIRKQEALVNNLLNTPNTPETQAALKELTRLEHKYDKFISSRSALNNSNKSTLLKKKINDQPQLKNPSKVKFSTQQSPTTHSTPSLEQKNPNIPPSKPMSDKAKLLYELKNKAQDEFLAAKKAPASKEAHARKIELENKYLDLCKQLRLAEKEDTIKIVSDKPKNSMSCKISDDIFTFESQSNSKTLEALDLATSQKQTFDIPTALEENRFLKQHMALQKEFDSLKETHAMTPQHPKLVQCAQELEESTGKLKKLFDGYSLETLQSRTLPIKFTTEGNLFEYSVLEQENQFLRFYNYQRVTSQSLKPESTQINTSNPIENNKLSKPSTPKKSMGHTIPDEVFRSKPLTPADLEKLETKLEIEFEKVSDTLDKALTSQNGKKILKAENKFLKYHIKVYAKHSKYGGTYVLDALIENADLKLAEIVKADKSKSILTKLTELTSSESSLIAENQFLKHYIELEGECCRLENKYSLNHPKLIKGQEELKKAKTLLEKILNKKVSSSPTPQVATKTINKPKTMACDIPGDTLTPEKLEKLEKSQREKKEKKTKTGRKTSSQLPLKPQSQQANVLSLTQLELEAQQKLKAAEQAVMNIPQSLFEDNHPVAENASKKAATIEQQYKRLKQINNHQKSLQIPALGKGTTPTFASQSAYSSIKDLKIKRDIEVNKFFDAKQGRSKVAKFFPNQSKVLKAANKKEMKAFKAGKKLEKQIYEQTKRLTQDNISKHIAPNSLPKPASDNFIPQRVANNNPPPLKPKISKTEKVIQLPKKEIAKPERLHWQDPKTLTTPSDIKKQHSLPAKPSKPINKNNRVAQTKSTIGTSQEATQAAQSKTPKKPSTQPPAPAAKPTAPGTSLVTTEPPLPPQPSLGKTALKLVSTYKPLAGAAILTEMICKSDFGKNSSICKSLNLDEAAKQSKDVKNAHRDAFIQAATKIALDVGAFSIPVVGTAAGTTLLASSQAQSARQSIKSTDINKMCTPSADIFYQMYIGTTCKEYVEGLQVPLKAGQKLDAVVSKIAHFVADGIITGCNATGLTEENYKKAAEFVHNCIPQAPEFIQQSYQELLAEKKAYGSESDNRPSKTALQNFRKENQAFLKALLDSTDPKLDQSTRQKARAEYLKLTQADPTLEKRFVNLHKQLPLESTQKRTAQAHKKKVIADRNLSLSAEESAQKIAALLDDNFKSVNNKINELTEYIVQRDQQEFEYRQQEQQHEQFFNNINDGFTGAAALATIFGHHEAAYRIAALGGAAVQAASAISAFSAMGPMCGINPYVGTLSAIAGICSAFMNNSEDTTVEVILEAINNGIMHLSNQIEQFHKNMLVQFEHLHRTLNNHQRVILEKFFNLKADHKNMAQKLNELNTYIQENNAEIFGSIDSLHHKIDAQTQMISKEFQGIHSAEIDDLIQRAVFTSDDDIPETEFRTTMIELFTKGITRASTDSLTGGAVDVASYDALQTALYDSAQRKNPFEHPAFPCINLLSRYFAFKLPGFKHEPRVNPLIWIKCTATALNLLNSRLTDVHYPSTLRYKDSDLEKLHKLKQEGQKILDFIRMLHRNNYVQTVLADYQREAQSLAEAITLEKNKFEETETKKKLADYCAFVKKEKALMDALPQSYQCTQCIEETTKTIKAAHAIKANRGADLTKMLQSTLRPRPFIRLIDSFRGVQDAAECRELYTIDGVDSLCYFRDTLVPTTIEFQQKATRLNSATLSVNLAQEKMTYNWGMKSALLHPAKNTQNLPRLLLPGPIYTLLSQEPYFRLAENEIGTLKHYYTIEQEKFFVRSYLVFMTGETKNKILIQELVKPYTSDPLYTEHENVLHYWYEGRYPASKTDIYKIDATHSGNRYTGYYPPATPYPSGYLTFATTATKTAIDLEPIKLQIWNTFKKRKQEERIRFNQIICNALASHATTSEVFKASQKFDVSYKLLESYLMLMYNTRFKPDENSTNFVKNSTAIEHYCTEYKKIDNQENDQGNYLPHHITQTTQKVVDTFSHMLNQDNIPQIKPVENLIGSLDRLIKKYTKRPITKPKIKTEEYYRMARPTQQDFSNESADETMPISRERVLVSELIESNQELTAQVSRLKKQLATNNSKLDLITDQMSVMVSLVMQMKNNHMHTTSTLASFPPTEILEEPTLFLTLYSQPTSVKKVAIQKAAECGYHALFNALRCFSSSLSLPSFLRTNKAYIERQNSSFRDQWLSEDQMADLLERNKTEEMNITLIPDISLYEEGFHSLEHSVLEGLAQSQAALKNGLESYKHVFILGTMNSKNNDIMSHWVAVEQTIQNGKATYSIMNSLPSYPHDQQVVTLQNMLHNNNQQYDFNVFSTEVEHELSGYISQIHLATIFERQEYARTGESPRASTYRIVDKTLAQIVDNILSAAEKLLELTHGNSFWSTEGSVEPKNLIYEALIQIKECEGQEVLCKDKKSDENGKPTTLHITPEQKERIAQLEILLEI